MNLEYDFCTLFHPRLCLQDLEKENFMGFLRYLNEIACEKYTLSST